MRFISGARIPLNEEQFVDANTARFYDEHARRFMGLVYRRFAKKAAGISLSGNRVLDIGTGSGRPAIELAKAHTGLQITGIDVSENMLELARQNAIERGVIDKIEFQWGSGEAIPFNDNYFGLVVSHASLHLWQNPLKVFKEISRVTAPGGYCLIWDNVRLTRLNPLLSLVGWAMGMNSAQRRLWIQAMRSSYTLGEVGALLTKSALKDARITFYPWLLELGIAWKEQPK